MLVFFVLFFILLHHSADWDLQPFGALDDELWLVLRRFEEVTLHCTLVLCDSNQAEPLLR